MAVTKRKVAKKKTVTSKKKITGKKKVVARKKAMASKKKVSSKRKAMTSKKKAVSKKKAAVAKKKVVSKKKVTVAKKKVVNKKKATVAKKKVVNKKKATVAKKKVVSKKKATVAKKKVVSKKKATVAKKKVVSKKKATVAKKKVVSKKKATVAKKKVVQRKKVSNRKTVPGKKTDSPTSFDDFTPYKERRGEEYMNADQSDHFRSLLLVWLKDLQEEVDRTVDHMQSDASNFSDPNDRATQEEEFALELRTRDRERKLTKKIRTSLSEIESGDYGFCEVCGIEIGIRRLEARPTATLCIDCKTLDEIKEKQMG